MSALVSFREVDPEIDAGKILSWRRQPHVSIFMSTDVEDDVEAQLQWLESCFERTDYYHWIFSIGGKEAGLINISGFETGAGTTSWGYYIGERSLLGLGAVVPPFLYNWLFRAIGLNKIEVEVLANNQQVLNMHEYHGYCRRPDKDGVIFKGPEAIELRALELTRASWLSQDGMARFSAPFPTARWVPRGL